MASLQATEARGSGHPGANAGGVIEWFWRGHALQVAKSAPKASSVRRERLRRARLATELADRTIDPAEPLRDGSAVPLAISLYREAAYWALLAKSDSAEETARNVRELFDSASYNHPGLAEADLAQVRTVLAEHTFVETAEQKPEVVCRQADLCQAFVHGLIQTELEADDKVTGVLVQRWLRVGLLALAFGVVLVALSAQVQRMLQGPDLAASKTWRTSSKAFDCHPKDMECGGAHSAMFFHTNEENRPWLEIDLGKPTSFARVVVTNREDCCQERAVPLIVEVSDDQKTWREVAKRTETFRAWDATFKATTARYLRLRVDQGRVAFHLVKVAVHAR